MNRMAWIFLALHVAACGGASSYEAAPSAGYYGDGSLVVAQASAESVDAARVELEGEEVSGDLNNKPVLRKATEQEAAPVDLDQKLVKNAYMTVEVDDEEDFAPAIRKLAETAKRLQGYVASESQSSITFKVPTVRLEEALADVRKIGEITHSDVTVMDVTSQYVDLQIRIDNLRRLRTRLQELLVQGQNVQEVLEVEKELARVTRELEQLEGQMRLLKNQVGFATISVSFEDNVSPGPVGWIFYGTYQAVKWLFVWD